MNSGEAHVDCSGLVYRDVTDATRLRERLALQR
jgi:hypothetical protein